MATDVGNVIRSIEVAIERAWRDWVTNYRVERVELTLYAEASRDASAGIKFEIPDILVDGTTSAGVKAGEILVQEMKFVLIPPHGVQEHGVTGSPIDDSIAEAVAAIKSALEELRTSGGFSLPEAVISLKFTVTNEGNIAIPIGSYSRKSVLAHELVLTVKK